LLDEPRTANAQSASRRLRATMAAVRIAFTWMRVRKSLNTEQKSQAADTFGVTEQTIRNYQAMLTLDPAVIDAMIKEEISTTAALQLAALPRDDQRAVLNDIQDEQKDTGKKATVDRVKERVAEKTGKATNTPKDKIKRATNLLTKYALKNAGEKTKEEMASTLERLCRVLTGSGLDKLIAEDEE